MVSLAPLILSVSGQAAGETALAISASSDFDCRYCGARVGHVPVALAGETLASCALCGLVRHLERPRINEEARLVWVPEMSQAALNVLMRGFHVRLRGLGERPETDAQPSLAGGGRSLLYHGQQALLERAREVEVRLGSSGPWELADALVRLSAGAYARRDALLAGIRLLSMGRFFEGGADIYPDIVDSWRQGGTLLAKTAADSLEYLGGRG